MLALRAFHPEGELGAARAAKAKDTLQILSTVSSVSVEDIIKARGAPVWQQLYTTSNLDYGIRIAKRAADAGAPAIAVTVDLPLGRNVDEALRMVDALQFVETHGDQVCPANWTVGAEAMKPTAEGVATYLSKYAAGGQ